MGTGLGALFKKQLDVYLESDNPQKLVHSCPTVSTQWLLMNDDNTEKTVAKTVKTVAKTVKTDYHDELFQCRQR
jgi:hypothetical protein